MKTYDSIKDLMTSEVVTVGPETPLTDAATILFDRRLDGLPVVNDPNEKKVVGIITEYDFLMKGTQIHLPTFLKIMKEINVYKKDASPIKDDLKAILALKVKDVMNHEPLTLKDTISVAETAQAFADHHRVNPIPVVDEKGRLVGVVSRFDLLKFYAGAPPLRPEEKKAGEEGRALDKQVNAFIKSFDSDFTMVSKFRVRYWFLVSIIFVLVGFIIAFAFAVKMGVTL